MKRAAVLAAATVASGATTPAGAEVAPTRVPPRDTEVVASYGGTTMWVETIAGRDVVLLRRAGRTIELGVRPMSDLDLGPSRLGRAVVAVYPRCGPGCDLYRYDVLDRRETRVTTVSSSGFSERAPTVWGDSIAFVRRGRVRLGSLSHRGSRVLTRTVPDEMELGPKHLASRTLTDSDAGNGAVEVKLHGIASGREATLRSRVIGEGDSTGIGGPSFEDNGLFWKEVHRSGCDFGDPSYRLHATGRSVVRRVAAGQTPLETRRVTLVPPETPESEACPRQ